MPPGVNASGNAGTTLQTLDLESGHYRTSSESENVLECPRGEACVGGGIAGHYCATGYQGACETTGRKAFPPLRTTHTRFMPHTTRMAFAVVPGQPWLFALKQEDSSQSSLPRQLRVQLPQQLCGGVCFRVCGWMAECQT